MKGSNLYWADAHTQFHTLKDEQFASGEFPYGNSWEEFARQSLSASGEAFVKNANLFLSLIMDARDMPDSAMYFARLAADSAAIGWCYYHEGKYSEARAALEPLRQQRQGIFGFEVHWGAVMVKLGDVESGMKLLSDLMKDDSTFTIYKTYDYVVEAHRILGDLLIDLNRFDEALKHLTKGRAMAEKSGMKGELKKYDELFTRLKEF